MSRHPEHPARGARYFRADLQVHTPVDTRWDGERPTGEDERAALARSYLAAAQDQGIEVVAITEHHDVSWIDTMRHAAQQLQMYLFPGFELETQEGIHLLCLFEPATRTVDLEETLALLGLASARRERSKRTEIRSTSTLGDAVALVQDQRDGICIAAHVTSTKGLLNALDGGARADCWRTPHLLAAQIPRSVDAIEHPGTRSILRNEDPNFRRQRPLAYVLTSDSRSPAEIGTASVWIKMQHPSIEGLRQAFLDPASRIACDDPAAWRPRGEIRSVRWEGGFFSGTAMGINPELTCLIGGRGTGKSTVIESIRWAMQLDRPELDGDQQALLSRTIRPGTKVTVELRTSAPAARHTVERTMPHGAIVRDAAGTPLADVQPADLLPLTVFSQKQLYETAQSDAGRLDLVDGFAGRELDEPRRRIRSTLTALSANAKDVRSLRDRIAAWDADLAELPSLEQWRARFADAGFEDRLSDRRALDREDATLKRLDASLLQRRRALDVAGTEVGPLATTDVPSQWPNHDLVAQGVAAAERGFEAFSDSLDAGREGLDAARDALAALRAGWEARRAERQADFDRALRELQRAMPDVDPERYLDVERRIGSLTPLQAQREQAAERLRSAYADRRRLLVELGDARDARFRARDAAAAQLTAATGNEVRVSVEYQAGREAVLDSLRRAKTGVRSAALDALVGHDQFSPVRYAETVRSGAVGEAFGLTDATAAALIRECDEDMLLEFEATELADEAVVALDVGDPPTRNYRSLDQLSPGQKSTAILLLALHSEAGPLLVDQPEDDLDNRFVYGDVVQRLRAAKTTRQIIVATHNANIPVLGDAEQIIVLDAVAGDPPTGVVVAAGPIDDEPVRVAAEQILEGGEQAFRRRREKYGW